MSNDDRVQEARIAYTSTPTVDMPVLLAADEAGIRLEVVNGLPMWELHPGFRHQKVVDEIRSTLGPVPAAPATCGCFHYADVYIRFPDGSLKRPDIAVFCTEPTETNDALEIIPEAVIEVVSEGYEAKDLEIGPRFYLTQGVKDIVVYDPRTLLVMHFRRDGTRRLLPPADIVLQCGCSCRIVKRET